MNDEVGSREDRHISVHTEALRAAVMLEHSLPQALTMALPPALESSAEFHTPASADAANEVARTIERATVARVLRVADEFAAFIQTGMSAETRAATELMLSEHLGE